MPVTTTLPRPSSGLYLTDGGLETSLIFDQGIDLPAFAAFVLLDSNAGRDALVRYFTPYLRVAQAHGTGFVFETPTWRANPDWGSQVGYDSHELARVNRDAVHFMRDLARGAGIDPSVVSGNVGPRGDGYVVDGAMGIEEAAAYHRPQVDAFAEAGADIVTALTLNYSAEGAGIARAAAATGTPAVISFTVETDGHLPSGESLGEAIERIEAVVPGAVAHYMINCAHPTHFERALATDAAWLARIGGIRANASRLSHAELEATSELDAGDPIDLGRHYRGLQARMPGLSVFGGCCGTDQRHIGAIGAAVTRAASAAPTGASV